MPKVQLIRRDGQVIELNASSVNFSITRGVAVWPIPIFGVRAGLDLNNNTLAVEVSGILVDDTEPSGSAGAVAHFDLSRPTGLFDSWFKQQQAQGNDTIAKVVTALHGKEITFKTAGQTTAALGENNTLRFYSSGSVPAATVATKSIIPVDLTGSINNTGDITTAINTALTAASLKVNAATTPLTSVLTLTQGAGAKVNSGTHQGVGTLTNEKLTLSNITKGSDGNSILTKQGFSALTTQDWTASFFTSHFTGGVTGTRKSKGDKVQDLINMTINASAGGGMISPQSFTGDLIEMPDSLSSFDVSSLLRIDQSDSVKKYIVGLRIPYESIITATGATEEVRQFIVPSGPGTDYAAEKNTQPFDPVEIVDGETVRPNPFLRQGVAIPGVIQTFNPSYEAGDSVWNYSLSFTACEQLLGI